MRRAARKRMYLAAVGSVVVAVIGGYVLTGLDSTLPEGRRGDAMASDAQPDGHAAVDLEAADALVGTVDLETSAGEPYCSGLEDVGDRLLAARVNEEFKGLSGDLPALAVELAADMAGLEPDLREGRALPLAAFLSVLSWPAYPLPEPAEQRLSWSQEDRLQRLIEDGALATVFEHPSLSGRRDATLDAEDPAGRDRATTVLGAIMLRYGGSPDRWLPHVPADWPVGIHDLAIAAEAGVAVAAFETLLDRSDAADASWAGSFGGEVNLAQFAAYHMRPELLRILMARGVSPVATKQPLLDDIARRAEVSEHEADIVAMLVAAGLNVRRPTTLRVLEARHPHQSGLLLHPEVEEALASPGVSELARRLAEAKGRWQAERDAHEVRQEHCREQQIAAALESGSPGDGLTLAGKRRYDQDLRNAREQELREIRATLLGPSSGGQGNGQLGDLVGRVYDSAIRGRWDDAMAAADEVPPPLNEVVNADLLSHALRAGASMEVFEALLDRNDGLLPADAILDLSSRGWDGAASVAEALLGHGLDAHYEDRFGRNAFSRVAANSSYGGGWRASYDQGMASFLASQGVRPKPSSLGIDPLDEVLSAMVSLGVGDSGLWLARLLVDHGAPIEASHRELARRIAVLHPNGHLKLVQAIPLFGQ